MYKIDRHRTTTRSNHKWTVCVSKRMHYKSNFHDDVIKWKHFPRYLPFVRGIQWSPVNSPHKDWWRGALMFSLICAWIPGVNKREAGDLGRHVALFDVIVMRTNTIVVGNAFCFILLHSNIYMTLQLHKINQQWHTNNFNAVTSFLTKKIPK